MDDLTKEQRHKNMSNIRSKNTKPEEIVRKFLFANGFRYKKNDGKLAGCPDIVLSRWRTVVFVNGCFWHQHEGCRYTAVPKSNTDYWVPKLRKNVDRDHRIKEDLENSGWRVVVVWECELKKKQCEERLNKLACQIREKKD